MKKVGLALMLGALLSVPAFAGRTGATKIDHIIIKQTHVEIYTTVEGGCGGSPKRWHLLNTHGNFDALLSAFLATKAADKEVDIVGNGNCPGYEEIDWAYVLR